MMLTNIPVELTVKLGGKSALDPAPTTMCENIINYKSEYAQSKGRRWRFKVDNENRSSPFQVIV